MLPDRVAMVGLGSPGVSVTPDSVSKVFNNSSCSHVYNIQHTAKQYWAYKGKNQRDD